jgi:hypothetical protein
MQVMKMLMIMMKLILTKFVFAKKFNLEFKTEVNNFPTQLISVIARKLSGTDGFPLFL